MATVYVYVLDTLADWELGYVTSELKSGRFFKKDAPDITLKTLGCSKEPILTMGGLTVVPDCTVDSMVISKETTLLLPGADTWSDSKHAAILQKAGELLSVGGGVCAICGATVALAGMGFLDARPHTANGPGFLEMFVPSYQGNAFYVDLPSVRDDNLITASATGSLLWAKQILEYLDVFQADTLQAWYEYFQTGRPELFYALMQTLPAKT